MGKICWKSVFESSQKVTWKNLTTDCPEFRLGILSSNGEAKNRVNLVLQLSHTFTNSH